MQEIVKRLKEQREIELAKSILESNGYKVSKVDEGLFDNKKNKTANYEQAIQQIFKDPTMRVVSNVLSAAETLISDSSDNEQKNIEGFIRQVEALTRTITNETKRDPSRSIATLLNLGRKYARDSVGLEELTEIQSNLTQLKKVEKIGYDAADYLLNKINPELVRRLTQTLDHFKREYR